VLLALPPADDLLIEEIAANSCLLGDATNARLRENPSTTQFRAAYPRRCSSNASGLHVRNSARIGKSARAFKGIICDDVSEFESDMPSHAVGLSEIRSRTENERGDYKAEEDPRPVSVCSPGRHKKMDRDPQTHRESQSKPNQIANRPTPGTTSNPANRAGRLPGRGSRNSCRTTGPAVEQWAARH
jgi:hypothetical protein